MRLISIVCLFLFSLPTVAQKAEVFGGFQLTRFNGGLKSNGWNAAVTGNVLPFLGLTADFSGVYNSGAFYTYTFGPEVHARVFGLKPFAHALFGGGTFTNVGIPASTGFTTYLGGGVDVKILPFLSARLAQADWMTTRFPNETESRPGRSKNNVRFSAGLVLRF
jgi:hypothetical protein